LNDSELQELKFFGKNQTVLVAESTPQIARKMKQVLYPFFKDVHIANTTQKALVEYKAYKFDLVICSLSKTINFSGLDIIKQIRNMAVSQVIIVNSGDFEKDVIISLFDIGINAFIPIPYTQDDFLYKIIQQSEKIYYNSFTYESPKKSSPQKSVEKKEEKPKEEPKPVDTTPKKKLTVDTRVNVYNEKIDIKISAVDFMEELEAREDFSILKYTIDGFLDIDQDFEKHINKMIINNGSDEMPELMEELSELLFNYEDSLEKFDEFTVLAESFGSLAEFVYDMKDEKEINVKVFDLFSFLNDDLTSFISHVFDLKDVENIHYLDDSMISSLEQIKYTFKKEEYDEDDDDDLELF
jgi:DNA-binding response OmpR family regulator